MGDLFEVTPKDAMSKVYLEHKMFDTWFYKRSVLIGDGKSKTSKKKRVSIGSLDTFVIVVACESQQQNNSFVPFLRSFAFSLACHKVN